VLLAVPSFADTRVKLLALHLSSTTSTLLKRLPISNLEREKALESSPQSPTERLVVVHPVRRLLQTAFFRQRDIAYQCGFSTSAALGRPPMLAHIIRDHPIQLIYSRLREIEEDGAKLAARSLAGEARSTTLKPSESTRQRTHPSLCITTIFRLYVPS
jgi:hypothetical protein